jgi:hypothetical protein
VVVVVVVVVVVGAEGTRNRTNITRQKLTKPPMKKGRSHVGLR